MSRLCLAEVRRHIEGRRTDPRCVDAPNRSPVAGPPTSSAIRQHVFHDAAFRAGEEFTIAHVDTELAGFLPDPDELASHGHQGFRWGDRFFVFDVFLRVGLFCVALVNSFPLPLLCSQKLRGFSSRLALCRTGPDCSQDSAWGLLDYGEQNQSRAFWRPASLLPVPHGPHADTERRGELVLRQAKLLPGCYNVDVTGPYLMDAATRLLTP